VYVNRGAAIAVVHYLVLLFFVILRVVVGDLLSGLSYHRSHALPSGSSELPAGCGRHDEVPLNRHSQ
jgi:hypothetical protein